MKKKTDFVLLSFYFAMATIILLLVCLFLFIRGNNLEIKGFLKGYETASSSYHAIAFLSYNEGWVDCKENMFNPDDLTAISILESYNITYIGEKEIGEEKGK
jgi:ABC-type siderophore export system fused ATPase/permease subunit